MKYFRSGDNMRLFLDIFMIKILIPKINKQRYGTLIHQQQNKFVPFMTCNSVISNVFVKQKIYLTPLVCKLPFSYQALNFEIKIDTLTQQIENSALVV